MHRDAEINRDVQCFSCIPSFQLSLKIWTSSIPVNVKGELHYDYSSSLHMRGDQLPVSANPALLFSIQIAYK